MPDVIAIREIDFVSINQTDNQLIATDGDILSIVELNPQLIEARSTDLELVITNDPQSIVVVTDPIILISDTFSNNAGLTIWDEGGLVSKNVTDIDFSGSDVLAKLTSTGKVTVYIPTPSYVSHFNTSDGVNNSSIPNVAVSNRHISMPTLEGVPFLIGDWITTQIHQVVNSPTLSYTTPAPFSILNKATSFTVVILNQAGDPLITLTTPAVTGNGVHTSQDASISINIFGWNVDADRFQANLSVFINLSSILPDGGRFGVSIRHDNGSDGVFYKVQSPLFYDTNTIAASFTSVSIAVTNTVSHKYLSGIRYYTLGDSFKVDTTELVGINSNSYPDPVLIVTGDDFGLSPASLTVDSLTGWLPKHDHNSSIYSGLHSITRQNYRFVGAGSAHAAIMDWGVSQSRTSNSILVVIDTYPRSSTPLIENFEDEYYRQNQNFNDGFTTGNWISDLPLQQGDAMVFGGELITPSEVRNLTPALTQITPDLPSHYPKKEDGTNNPDYLGFSTPSNYYRTFVCPNQSREIVNFQIYIDGTFVGADVNADINSGYIKLFIRRMWADMTSNFGATSTPTTITQKFYNFNYFDDGATDGDVKLGNSSGNMIGCTSGGIDAQKGIHLHIQLLDPRIRLKKVRLEFN